MQNLDVTKLKTLLEKYSVSLEDFISHFNFDGDVNIDDIILYLENVKQDKENETLQRKENINKERKDYLDKMIKQTQEKNREILPLTNICEDNDCLYIEMVIPKLNKENINITIEDQYLKVKGKYECSDMKDRKYHQYEFKLIDFKKEILLGDFLDLESVTSKYKDGILSINIKKQIRPSIKKEIIIK